MLSTPRQRSHKAFTLTELLIVLAILGMLASIVLPTLERVAALGRRTICANRLNDIAKAFQMRVSGGHFDGQKPFNVHNDWATQLMFQVSFSEEVFLCPDDPHPRPGGTGPALEREWFGDPGQRMDLDLFTTEPIWDLYDMDELGEVGVEVPHVWKVNPDVYDTLTLAEGQKQTLPKYTPGSDPYEYYLLVEDAGGGDHDFEDLVFKVKKEPRGTWGISCVRKGSTVHTHDLASTDWTVDNIQGMSAVYDFVLRGPISYGMTRYADRPGFQDRTILVLDYEEDVVYPDTDNDDANWDAHYAPRHLDRCNVAFADGSVQALLPNTIDPNYVENRQEYWNPSGVEE